MAISKTTVVVNNIQSLADTPSSLDGLTTQTFKAKFDQTGADLKDYINDDLTEELDTKFGTIDASLANIKTITDGTSNPSGGVDGDIYIQYV